MKETDYEVEVTLDPSISSCNVPARRIPLALLPDVEDKIAKQCKAGVLMKIEEPTKWCSPLVVVKKKSGDLRICADLRKVNAAVLRPKFQIPSLDQIISNLSGACVFSQLDMRSGYYQFRVAEDSKAIFTVAVPSGRYCYQRLPFGYSAAPDIFQAYMINLLAGIPNVLVYLDDILIASSNHKEHNNTLAEVFKRLFDKGIRLNKKKCNFYADQLEFLGHKFSKEGCAPSEDKIRAISNMDLPSTREDLRSFLGLAQYIGHRFVPNFASLLKPLYDLAFEKNGHFEWNDDLRSTFYKVKKDVANITSVTWFDGSKPVIVETDASGKGLGAVLIQDEKPILYVSRALSDVESRYSQIERECLAVRFAFQKLHYYLYGRKFILRIDNKPLCAIFNKKYDDSPLRIQRWLLYIQNYTFDVVHISGKSNMLADALSRNPLQDSIVYDNVFDTVCFVLKCPPLNIRRIATVTAQDAILKRVFEAIQRDWIDPEYVYLNRYYSK